jgi:ribosomal protein S18 acetylase RimI-like enzyme
MTSTPPGTRPRAALRPMRPDEFATAIAATRAGYARDIEVNGGYPRSMALQRAEDDIARILPDGLATDGQLFFVIEAEGGPVGRLWLAERASGTVRTLFIYEIEIDAAARGKGLGRAAMLLAEAEATARGITRIELNVFGGNEVARGLYRSLGYLESAVQMAKELT